MLSSGEAHVTAGLAALDAALEGLLPGDNVAWEVAAPGLAAPFAEALARAHADAAAWVTFSDPAAVRRRVRGVEVVDARATRPAPLLAALRRLSGPGGARVVVVDALDAAVAAWGAAAAGRFVVRACPLLLEAGVVTAWSIGLREHLAPLRRELEGVAQCVLVLRDGRLRVAKAEGRSAGVQGSVHRYRFAGGTLVLTAAPAAARVGAALRQVRAERGLTQAGLAALAGVSASAVSQAERGRRGLSLDTLLALAGRLGMTVDDLLGGRMAPGYRVGRGRAGPGPVALLADRRAGLRAFAVALEPGAEAEPPARDAGVEAVFVADGLVQVVLEVGRPLLRAGDAVLVAGGGVRRWRNLGDRPARAFWVVRDDPPAG